MSEQITITVSQEIYKRIVQQAKEDRKDVSEVVNELVTTVYAPKKTAVNPKRKQMQKEADAFRKMHKKLKQKYLGEYVAILNGNVVDHDKDKDLLFMRIKTQYPNDLVLQRQVLEKPEPELKFRSPHIH